MNKCTAILFASLGLSLALFSCADDGGLDAFIKPSLPELSIVLPSSLGIEADGNLTSAISKTMATPETLGVRENSALSYLWYLDESRSPYLNIYISIKDYLETLEQELDFSQVHRVVINDGIVFFKIITCSETMVESLVYRIDRGDNDNFGHITIEGVDSDRMITITSLILDDIVSGPERAEVFLYSPASSNIKIAHFVAEQGELVTQMYFELSQDNAGEVIGLSIMPNGIIFDGHPTSSQTLLVADESNAVIHSRHFDESTTYLRELELLDGSGNVAYHKQAGYFEPPYYTQEGTSFGNLRGTNSDITSAPAWFFTREHEGSVYWSIDGDGWSPLPSGQVYCWLSSDTLEDGDTVYHLVDVNVASAISTYFGEVYHGNVTFWENDADLSEYLVYHSLFLVEGLPFKNSGFYLSYSGTEMNRRWWWENSEELIENDPEAYTPFFDEPLAFIAETGSSDYLDGLPRAYFSTRNILIIPDWLNVDAETIADYESRIRLLSVDYLSHFDVDSVPCPASLSETEYYALTE